MAKISISFALALVLAQSSFAQNRLSDALLNSTISGEVRAFYFDRDKKSSHEDILATGVLLKIETANFYGLKIGATTQLATNPWTNDNAKDMFNNDMTTEGARLSEAYLDYTYSNTNLRGGRTFLSTPLIAGSASRLIRESFEGVHLTNKDINNTTLGFVYIDKFQSRTDRKGDIGKFLDYRNGVYSVYIKNNSIENLNLIGSFAKIDEFMKDESNLDIYSAEAIYKNSIGNLKYDLNTQYWLNKYNHQNVDKINGYALKIGLSYSDFSSYIAYSKISNDNVSINQLLHGVGNGSDTIYTNSLISSYNYEPNMKAYAFNLDYKLSSIFKVGTMYTYTDIKNIEKVSYSGVYTNVDLNNLLKGLSTQVQYEKVGKDKDLNELRVKLFYKF
ncbi:porin [Arcobacter sp. FW59]|nr:porin [Arcobacter sp. FW59]